MRSKQGRRRFDIYNPFGDLGNSEEVGILPCDQDYELGTPNLERNENLTYVASSSSLRECLLVRLKWRPCGPANPSVVTLISKLELVLEGQVYEFHEVDAYEPRESFMRPGRITQYGTRSLKVTVASPYRRVRIAFNGHMRQTITGSRVFIKLSCVLNPYSEIFDFLDAPGLAPGARHDRHEQRFRFNGEYLLVDQRAERRPQAIPFALWGWQIKQFLPATTTTGPPTPPPLDYRRLYACMNNGQAFHVGVSRPSAQLVDQQQAAELASWSKFGYTAFDIRPIIEPLGAPYELLEAPGGELGAELDKFKLALANQKCAFECSGERYLARWFRAEMNGKQGWAWLSLDDGLVESAAEREAIERARSERELALKLGQLCAPIDAAAATTTTATTARSDSDDAREPLVVAIDQAQCRSSELVGAKAASLAQLLAYSESAPNTHKEDTEASEQKQFLVPYGFVLTRHAHALILAESAPLRAAIEELTRFVGELGAGDVFGNLCDPEQLQRRQERQQEDTEKLRVECTKLEKLMRDTKLPQAIEEELWQKLAARYGDELATCNAERATGGAGLNERSFAVRSSSWGEDEDEMSAAGQLATLLNVRPERAALAAACMACFASKFSCENLQYKRQHGQPLDLPMAVVVQEMVACDKAGVLFTCNPTTGDESALTITANYGLGESVVSAQADPDSIRVRVALDDTNGAGGDEKSDEKLHIEQVSVGQKKVIIGGGGGGDNENSQHDRSKCCLADEEILRLARCGRAVSRYFWNQRRDIEWGLRGGQLYLFQARPVTGGLEAYTHEELLHESERPNSAERPCYTRANVGEVMPYAARPLTLTYHVFAWNAVGFALVSKYLDEKFYIPQASVDVLHEQYHSFFNLRCSVLFAFAEKTVLSKAMEIGFFGRELGPQPEIAEASRGFVRPPSPFTGLRYKLLTLPLQWTPRRVILREYAIIRKLRDDVRNLRLARGNERGNKLLALYNQMQAALRGMRPCWDNHIHLVMMANNANFPLSALLSQYIKDPLQLSAATNKFLAISSDVVSAEIPRRVRAMAAMVGDGDGDGDGDAKDSQARQRERERFASMNCDEALEYLSASGGGASAELRAAYADFCENFGHRSYNEFELHTKAWREEPRQVIEMIQKNCRDARADDACAQEPAPARPSTIDEVIKSLGVDLKLKDKLLVKHVLAPKCQLMLSMRERTKDILVMFGDVLREATRMMARELVRQLRLPDVDLFYYLMYEELKPLVEGHQPAIVMRALRRRQMFERTFSQPWKFDEIIREIVPNHLKPARELDEALAQAPRLSGTPASSGRVRGRVCLVNGYQELARVRPNCILLTHSTDIAFSPVFPLVSGIITEVGGLISHGAVVAREYGLPSVIGIPDVTMILQDGEEIILDADNGAIIRLSKIGDQQQ